MLFRVTDAIDCMAAVLDTDIYQAVEAAQPQQIKLMLDVVYAGRTKPTHDSLIDGLGAMVLQSLRSRIKFAKLYRERCLAAIIVGIGKRHGIEINLAPLKDTEVAFCRFRDDPNVTPSDVARWLRSRVVDGDPDVGVRLQFRDQPLRGCVAALSHAITFAHSAGVANNRRDHFLISGLTQEFARSGGQLLAPVPRRAADGEGHRTNRDVLSSAVDRLRRVSVVAALGDSNSAGVVSEIRLAAQLGLTPILIQSDSTRSPWYDDDRIVILPHHNMLGRVPTLLTQWLAANTWRWHNSMRASADRDIVRARERTKLARAWDSLPEGRQDALAETIGLDRSRIELALGSGVGMEAVGMGEMSALAAAFGYSLGSSTEAPFQYDPLELEALAAVCDERKLSVTEGFQAAMDVLVELSSKGDRRGRLKTRRLWRQYFDGVGLDNR